ncbi:MAG: monovalent cation/H(+) antiporter subunit G [Spirochaetales bacterium]|nr:monovalent cation/H(+) antiporter subunit G [Spirochaetales bacterium]
MQVLEILGGILTLLGSLFLLLASIGIVRMPDTYNRMQTGTKATTLGSLLFFIGIGLAHPQMWGKITALIIFILITNPLSSHVLARALHYTGVSPILKKKRDMHTESRDDLRSDILEYEAQQHAESDIQSSGTHSDPGVSEDFIADAAAAENRKAADGKSGSRKKPASTAGGSTS